MPEQDLVNYIIQAQNHGLSDTEIKQNLLNAGWEAVAVEQAFSHSKALVGLQPGKTQLQRPKSSFVDQSSLTLITGTIQKSGPEDAPQDEAKPDLKKSRGHKSLVWTIIVAGLLFLAGGAYAYYSLILANPTKIWEKFTQSGTSSVYQTKFDFTYSDQGEVDSNTTSPITFQLKDLKLQLSGNGYLNAQDKNNPESDSQIQYTFGSGNTSFSTGLQYILQNKILYLNVGDNPILDLISQAANGGQKIDWIKIDLNQLNSQASSSPEQAKLLQQLSSPDFKNQLQQIWASTTLVKEDSYVGREKINGTTTLHFKNSIDKSALKGLINQYVQTLAKAFSGSSMEISDGDAATINQLASQLVDKIQISQFDTWVGLSDFKLYQVRLAVNAPSFISLVKNASTFNAPASNDAKRVADMRQMASALETYYKGNNGYPDAQNGQPLDLAPVYINSIPSAPPTEGNCSDFYNTYWYQPSGTKTLVRGKTVYQSYQITFCLGAASDGYPAGIAKLTTAGISANIACPGSAQHCAKSADALDPDQAIKQEVAAFIGKLDFSAQIQADANYSDYGQITTVTPPASSFDILQKFQQTQSLSQDASRLAAVRQLASALELYYNDKNYYPNNLNDLMPAYIGVVPTAPPASGTCSAQDNSYTYSKLSSGKYQMTFCLGQAIGGYSAGKHVLTEAGIQ